jgi:hypothetical protein
LHVRRKNYSPHGNCLNWREIFVCRVCQRLSVACGPGSQRCWSDRKFKATSRICSWFNASVVAIQRWKVSAIIRKELATQLTSFMTCKTMHCSSLMRAVSVAPRAPRPENALSGRECLVGAVSPLDCEVARLDSHSRQNEPQQKQHPPVA